MGQGFVNQTCESDQFCHNQEKSRYGSSPEYYYQKTEERKEREDIPITGLSNHDGKTCYVNAILQVLLHSEPFMEDIKKYEKIEELCGLLSEIKKEGDSYNLYRLLKRLKRILLVRKIISEGYGDSFKFFHKLFDNFRRSEVKIDSFMSTYLEFHGDVECSCLKGTDAPPPPPVAKISHHFQIEVSKSVQDSVSELIERRRRDFQCKKCGKRIEKYEKLAENPKCLFLRVETNAQSIEVQERVKMNRGMYELKSAVVHRHCHYISYVKKDDRFFSCSDRRVCEKEKHRVMDDLEEYAGSRKRMLILLYELVEEKEEKKLKDMPDPVFNLSDTGLKMGNVVQFLGNFEQRIMKKVDEKVKEENEELKDKLTLLEWKCNRLDANYESKALQVVELEKKVKELQEKIKCQEKEMGVVKRETKSLKAVVVSPEWHHREYDLSHINMEKFS